MCGNWKTEMKHLCTFLWGVKMTHSTSVPSYGVRLSICGGRPNARGTRRNAAAHLRLSRSIRPASSLPPYVCRCVSYTVTSSMSSAQPSGNAALLALQAGGLGGGGRLAPAQAFLYNLCPFFVSRSVFESSAVISCRRSPLWLFCFFLTRLLQKKKQKNRKYQ